MAAKKRAKKSGPKSRKQASRSVVIEMRHMRSGKHKVKSKKQAVAIGL